MPPHQPKLAGSRINRQSVAYLVSETSKNIQETPQLDPNATPELIAALDSNSGQLTIPIWPRRSKSHRQRLTHRALHRPFIPHAMNTCTRPHVNLKLSTVVQTGLSLDGNFEH